MEYEFSFDFLYIFITSSIVHNALSPSSIIMMGEGAERTMTQDNIT